MTTQSDNSQRVPDVLLQKIATIVGDRGLLVDPHEFAPRLIEDRGLYQGSARALVRPESTSQVAQVVAACRHAGVPLTPQGGNTGLCGGGVPDGGLILSLERMNQVLAVDPLNLTMTVEAGCILANVQEAADQHGCLFPLSLGSEGTCQIGGNLSTNAGGTNVLRYGNARDLVLGLEVVLADGSVWDGMRALVKDNTGYALKHLFVGAEGTLGIITKAILKLFPAPQDVQTALCAVEDVHHVMELLSRARASSGDSVTGFELICQFAMAITEKHMPASANPLPGHHPWYVLVELSSPRADAHLRDALEQLLEKALDDQLIVDATIAENKRQSQHFWRIRDSISEAQKHEGGSIKHDVSVPLSRMPEFIERASEALRARYPGVRLCPFGHVGDGNLHFNATQPAGADKATFLAQWGQMNEVVHDIVVAFGGSISAEHGVGKLKVEEIAKYQGPTHQALLGAIKLALDPDNILNPGKVVPPRPRRDVLGWLGQAPRSEETP